MEVFFINLYVKLRNISVLYLLSCFFLTDFTAPRCTQFLWIYHSFSTFISKSEAQPLAAQKPITIQVCWREKFTLFWMLAVVQGEAGERVVCCPKANFPPPLLIWPKSVGKSFFTWKEGATCRNSFNSHLEIGHWWSDQHLLDCFTYS